MSEEVRGFGEVSQKGQSEEQQVRQHNESISSDEHGLITLTEVWQGNYIDVCKFAQKTKKSKTLDDLVRFSWGAQKLTGNQGRVSIVFKGVPSGYKSAKFRLNVGTRSEPIETHPYFSNGKDIGDGKTEFSGQAADSAYGYKFGGDISSGKKGSDNASFSPSADGQGKVFSHFSNEAGFDLSGITQFITHNVVINAVYVSHSTISSPEDFDISKTAIKGGFALRIGQWFKSIPGCKITAGDFTNELKGEKKNHSWLCTRANTELIGSALRQDCDFQLSGPLGINPLIYPASSLKGGFNANFFEAL